MIVTFYDIGTVADDKLKFAVIIAKYKGEWIFVQHKERNTWEIPGGRREVDEAIEDTAKRELYEETGAVSFDLKPLCCYSVKRVNREESYGALFYAEVKGMGQIPVESEIRKITLLKEMPIELTYPEIQPLLHERALKMLGIRDNQK
ncbi:NUDIX domain-containing protein [Paenibacillus puldeungensis]|uniref:NUDIX domain-containing protein n=1 Tax=Paenibacillus puldeungensis TaxID=696536 RepID=A0ABW3RU46_9BACL